MSEEKESLDSLKGQIKDLSEKLVFAHETIAIMEDEHKKGSKRPQDSQSEEDDQDEAADKMSEGSNPSAKMVDRMISDAQKQMVKFGFRDSQSTILGGQD